MQQDYQIRNEGEESLICLKIQIIQEQKLRIHLLYHNLHLHKMNNMELQDSMLLPLLLVLFDLLVFTYALLNHLNSKQVSHRKSRLRYKNRILACA